VIKAGPAEADLAPADLVSGNGHSQGDRAFQRAPALTLGADGGAVKAVMTQPGQGLALSQAAGAGFPGFGRQDKAEFLAGLRPKNGQTANDVQALFPTAFPVVRPGRPIGPRGFTPGPIFCRSGRQELFISILGFDEFFHIGPARARGVRVAFFGHLPKSGLDLIYGSTFAEIQVVIETLAGHGGLLSEVLKPALFKSKTRAIIKIALFLMCYFKNHIF
jgi:hypothetical protein